MYKSKRQKNRSFDWYGLSQRFSIRKYHFGAESVLLGTALILGAAQTTAKAEEAATDNKTEAVTSTSKDAEGAVAPANVTLPATEATTGSPVLYKKELSEEEIAKLAAEVSKKDEKATETATTDKPEDADKEKATLIATSIDKKSEKAVDDKADKKDEKKAEKPIAATKTILEQLTSEAEVLNTTAANYAEKKVEDKSSKEAIAAAVAAAKVEITASKKVLNDKDVTAEQLNLQLQRMSSAIEAVYTEMKRAGHVGKVEAVLAGETTTNTAIVSPTTKTPVKNINELTDEEVAAVKREIMNANPSITDPSMIEVVKKGNGTAGGATVTLNGVKSNIPSGDTVVGTAGTKNLEQLKNNINWFDFAAASITYPNGTVVGPARRLAQPITKTVTYPNGDGKADVPATDTTKGWKAAGTAKFAEKTSPVVKGYVVKPNQDTQGDLVEADGSKVKASTTDLTVDSPNQDLKVRYVPVGTWTPKVAKGETPIDPIPYPKDPGKLVDPNDPSKGYVPPTPENPTEDTQITYEKDTQKAKVTYVVEGTGTVLHTDNLEGKSGEPIEYSTVAKLAELKALGYDLVSDGFTTATDKNYDKDTKVDLSFVVTVTPHIEPIKPFDPINPNDPNTPKPGQPIDPNNPDGPKWTKELIEKLETTKHVTRTIIYVEDDTNKEVANRVTEKVTFTREAEINLVTGDIEYSQWRSNFDIFGSFKSPDVKGYVLKDSAQRVVEGKGVTETTPDETIKVVYVPVGKVTITVPPGVTSPTPITDTPYENVPGEPGKVVPPSPTKPTDPQDPNSPKVPVIPHIPGTTPQVPKDPTKPVDPNTNPLVPLEPVTPGKPEDGYKVPPVPTNPNTDTPIYYVNDKQKAITNFVDNNGKVVSDPVVDQGDSGSKFTKSDEVESKIKELVKKGYVVTSNEYPSDDKDRVFDKDKDKDQIFNVTLTPLIVPTDPNSPDKPQVPTDPTKPVGPNNPLKPVTPSTPEPGKPVFPEDPNSPVWPETVKDMVTESSATRTITYVDQNGKEVAATHTETIKFKRSAKVNLVTGEITYGEWTVVGDDTILDGNKLPKVDGYIARGGDIKESQEDVKAEVGKNITQTVVYAKLGSWIPRLPEGQTKVPPTQYPNDPTDPTKPGTDKTKVPYVPGFIPVDPTVYGWST